MRAPLAAWPLLLCLLAAPAAAAVPPCGEYAPDDDYAPLLSFAGNRVSAHDRAGNLDPAAWRYRIDGDRLSMRRADSDLLDTYRIHADGRLVLEPDEFRKEPLTYTRRDEAVCVPTLGAGVALAPPGTPEQGRRAAACAGGDVQSCVAQMMIDPEGSPQQRSQRLQTYCRQERSPYACEAWAESLKPDDPTAPLYLFRTVALPAPVLAALRVGCREADAPKACTQSAEQDWIAGRFASARETLRYACERRLGGDACKPLADLNDLALRDDAPARTPQQPCGTYASAQESLFDVFRFGDAHAAAVGNDGELSLLYRLRDDQVLVRHDKGDDFILRWFDGDTLLGMDDWTRYTVYRRGVPAQCAAVKLPIPGARAIETPYRVDTCALSDPGGAEACCRRGSLSACIGAGHSAALSGDWKRAAGYYDRVCAQHVREGCGNVVAAYHNSGDERLLAGIRQVCKDEPRSVACEELELASAAAVTRKQLEREVADSLQQLLQGVPAEDKAPKDEE
ncbi:hypothetical protein [Lysobacter silvisoli]|uniref:Sel1 repeat family protein n=1 Tax=Lysobacter silvisoli TaxID=2293254 RepID=A0A371JYP1_9GAMM|nr:hypothetical protein [Lysobacter silvisoli]RDZ26732.1 hypothetical protein DX914_17315 [Lysobacter silvisoli]